MEISILGFLLRSIGPKRSMEDGPSMTFIFKRKRKRKMQIELLMLGFGQENCFVINKI
jgi:hypothetical protein